MFYKFESKAPAISTSGSGKGRTQRPSPITAANILFVHAQTLNSSIVFNRFALDF